MPCCSFAQPLSDSLWPVDCSTPGLSVHHRLPEFTQTHVQRVSDAINHLVLCRPLLLLLSIFPSIRFFSNQSVLCFRWPKFWSFSFSIIPSNEYSGLISFRMDWLVSLISKGLLRVFSSTPVHTTVWRHQFFSAQLFFIVQLSHLYTTMGKVIALTIGTFVGMPGPRQTFHPHLLLIHPSFSPHETNCTCCCCC